MAKSRATPRANSTTRTVGDVDNVTGTKGVDFITVSNSVRNQELDLEGGLDRLKMQGTGNTIRISNIESIS